MATDNAFEQAIDGIADGVPINWSVVESGAENDEDRAYLKCLRVLSEIAGVHRSGLVSPPPDGAGSAAAADRDAEASTKDYIDLWGRYQLVEKVGEGSFGSVYRAWDPELEREVAIKILHQHISDADLKTRLLGEGRALARIRHPNVVSVFGVESHGDRVGLCMEFVRGETLEAELARRHTLGARETLLVGEDVCQALAAVHRAGFVHRDVKARNVMREQGGRIVLMDFGTGRETEAIKDRRFDIAGTPVYMAPEVLAGDAATPGSDVYSVGVLMYHLVTGEYPVMGRTLDDLRQAHRLGHRGRLVERRPDLPTPFVQVVESALAPTLADRCRSAGALLESLRAISSAQRPSIARRALLAVVALAGTIAVLTALGMLTSRIFNGTLSRSDFATDTFRDLLYWGTSSLVGPVAMLLFILTGFGLCVVLRKLLLATSGRAQRIDAAARHRARALALRLHLDDVTVLASAVLLASGSALIVAFWYFTPLIAAVFRDLSTAPVETLRLLAAPQGVLNRYKYDYRWTFMLIVNLSVLSWYFVLSTAHRKRESIHWGILVSAGAIIVLAVGLLSAPFRLLNYWGSQFDAVRWRGADCYILGERRDDLLLFCPQLQPSRNRIVKNTDTAIERTGVHESIFSSFADNRVTR